MLQELRMPAVHADGPGHHGPPVSAHWIEKLPRYAEVVKVAETRASKVVELKGQRDHARVQLKRGDRDCQKSATSSIASRYLSGALRRNARKQGKRMPRGRWQA